MKDLEKIKSEDLGCQVADANPGNFAIEQEVAQEVGATVPAPTEPSADDARELGAQLLVFLRRALLPIRSALRTALAAIYAHLDSRCNDYTPASYASFRILPYDPMGTPPTPRSVANLLTAITAFAPRKISNGSAPNDGIPDGVSLAHLLLSSEAASVTELKDEQGGWDYEDGRLATLLTWMPNVKTLTLGMKKIKGNGKMIMNNTKLEGTIRFPNLKEYGKPTADSNNGIIYGCPNVTELDMSQLESIDHYSRNDGDASYAMIGNMQGLTHVKFGKLTKLTGSWTGAYNYIIDCPALIDLEIGAGTAISMNWKYWNPTDKGTTFLQNFKEHIALRLTDQGSGLTLTLSQAVFDTIWNQDGTPKSTDPDSVIYQINKIIKTDKHWSVNRA